MMAKLFQTEMAVDRQKNKVQKIKCILNYLLQHHRKQLGDGQVVFERRVLNKQDRSRVFPGTRQVHDDCISLQSNRHFICGMEMLFSQAVPNNHQELG
jgi:hypothetical protein